VTALGLLLLAGAGFLAAAVQAVIGAGFGLVAAPLVMLLAPGLVPGPLLVVTVVLMGLAVVTGYRTGGRLGRADASLLIPAAVGIVIGAAAMSPALGWVGEHGAFVRTVVGVGVLAAVVPMLVPGFPPPAAGPVGMGGAGVLAGVLTVLAALPGPPLILTCPARNAARYRTGLAALFLVASVAALSVLGVGAGVAPDGWEGVGWFSLGMLAGFGAGAATCRRLPLSVVTYGSRLTVLAAGVALLVPGVG
jgi:uncharacterized membrane protein YfcA